jgi:hypothetical protein
MMVRMLSLLSLCCAFNLLKPISARERISSEILAPARLILSCKTSINPLLIVVEFAIELLLVLAFEEEPRWLLKEKTPIVQISRIKPATKVFIG